MWDFASQLRVPGRSRVHGRLYLSFCPIALHHFNFRSWWVCRWIPFEKGADLYPFCPGGGNRRGGRGVQLKNHTCLFKLNFLAPPNFCFCSVVWYSQLAFPALPDPPVPALPASSPRPQPQPYLHTLHPSGEFQRGGGGCKAKL